LKFSNYFPLFRSFISPNSNVSSLPRGGGGGISRRASTAASYANGSESQEALLPGFSDTMSLRVGTSHSGNNSKVLRRPYPSPTPPHMASTRFGSLPPKRTTRDGTLTNSPEVVGSLQVAVPALLTAPSRGSLNLSEALNALDLESLDLSNIDPCVASKLLEEIRRPGADLGPIIEKIRKSTTEKATSTTGSSASNPSTKCSNQKETKVVTFQDETSN